MGSTLARIRAAESPHSRWWFRLDTETRRYLLTHSSGDELPLEVWRACLASALAEGMVEREDWVVDLPAHHLPPAIAHYVDLLGESEGAR